MSKTERVLRSYLQRTLGVSEESWTVLPSSIGGRGVFATRDLRPGDLIFHDRPVVWGPRAKVEEPLCASCHRRGRIYSCPSGCFLPVCTPECSLSPHHVDECRVVRETMDLPEGVWRLDLVGTVVALRCLFLSPEDREVVACLQGNRGKDHGFEVDLLKRFMKKNLNKVDEKWMRQCCLAMDTNAFEFLKVLGDGSQTSLRGLYPLAAIMNHECSPNSSHVYDRNGVMRMTAARAIKAGEEITTSYTGLLWSTTIRHLNLARTKHFLCCCARCADTTEFGSLLSGLPCTGVDCQGVILPSQPLSSMSSWFCGACDAEVSFKQVTQIQSAQASVMQKLAGADPTTLAHFLGTQTTHLRPHSQMVIQLKLDLIWKLGHKDGFTWQELSQEMLALKERLSHEILSLVELLRLGYCRMKGLILLELNSTLREQQRRLQLDGITKPELEAEILSTASLAEVVLHGDAAVEDKLHSLNQSDPPQY